MARRGSGRDVHVFDDPAFDAPDVAAALRAAFKGEQVRLPAMLHESPAGSSGGAARWVEASAAPAFDEGGSVDHVVLTQGFPENAAGREANSWAELAKLRAQLVNAERLSAFLAIAGTRPLTQDSWEHTRQSLEPHDHALAMYATRDELVAELGLFLTDGSKKNDFMAFVHSFPSDEDAWATLDEAFPDSKRLRDGRVVIVSLYKAAFQGESTRIDYEHVGQVVDSLVKQAASDERRAVRLFVDASRQYFADARVEEWFAFESWLGRRLQARVGLVCAYRKQDVLRPEIFPRALETHAYRFGDK